MTNGRPHEGRVGEPEREKKVGQPEREHAVMMATKRGLEVCSASLLGCDRASERWQWSAGSQPCCIDIAFTVTGSTPPALAARTHRIRVETDLRRNSRPVPVIVLLSLPVSASVLLLSLAPKPLLACSTSASFNFISFSLH